MRSDKCYKKLNFNKFIKLDNVLIHIYKIIVLLLLNQWVKIIK